MKLSGWQEACSSVIKPGTYISGPRGFHPGDMTWGHAAPLSEDAVQQQQAGPMASI